ncbi:TonB-dependent receptor [Leptospira johnsonii]|uniref:TonB-dependent receptor plug domain / TonB-dependent receptor multi-domain protein n=1 Tax=Leptospira johnsonii TaxID=1917820 RepID=A0A2P2D0X1_9LEPT|nr:TonB-dependent receptor [Leptospira johnsonii]GBF38282.1 TonB-dependent receptor plug domain / TonB-dependent receptor multi-domain protein [Leptospira johnsonii]
MHKRPKRIGKILHLGLFLFSIQIFSQENQKTETSTVKVVGKTSSNSQPENFRKNPTGFQTSIDLDQYSARYTNLPDVLEREAGVRIRRYGGLGSYSTLSLRGTNPNQTRIFIDGVPFNNAQGGEVNLADLPFDNLQSIEVYRSGAPVGFSGSAIGGSVNLVTRTGSGPPKTRVNIGAGSFNTGKGSITHTGTYGGIGTSVFLLGEKSDQNFSYLNNHGTLLVNPLDDTIDRRRNAQYERTSGMLGLSGDIGATKIKFWNDLNYRFHGIPGPASNQTQQVHRRYLRNTSSLGTDTKGLFDGLLRLETRAFTSFTNDDLFDPKSEFSKGTPNSTAHMGQSGFQITPTLYLLEYYQILKFHAGVERETFERSRSTPQNIDLKYEPGKTRTYTTFQVEDEFRFLDGKLVLTTGVSWDSYRDKFQSDEPWYRKQNPFASSIKTTEFSNPKTGLLWRFWEKENYSLEFKSNIARQYRIPSFLELFGEVGTIIANDSLKPERSENADAGITGKYKNGELKSNITISYFRKRIKDMILFIPNSQFTLRPENVDSARIDGAEVSHKTEYKGWKFLLEYTYQEAINTSPAPYLNGKYLPLRPKHEISGTVAYRGKTWELGFEGVYVGAVFKDRTNEYVNYQPARQIWNAYLTLVLYSFPEEEDPTKKGEKTPKELLLSIDVRNMGDKRVEDIVGYPLPGRNWFITLSGRF